MLQDFAETLLIFTNYLSPSLNENDLYILIGSGVESLQKAAYVLLKFLYENYIPILTYQIDVTDEMKYLMIDSEEAKSKSEA